MLDDGDEVAAHFASVQCPLELSLEPIEEGLRSLEAFEYVAQRRVILVAVNPFRQAEIEHGIQPEKDCIVSVQCRGVLSDVAVVNVIVGSGDFAKKEKPALAERVSILANVGTEA